ncbi:hypothetical protein JCM8547_006721 [Rhodosporidiobolus lusitaniae]
MNRPTLPTLPEDVLEEIFGQLEASLVCKDKHASRQGLPSTHVRLPRSRAGRAPFPLCRSARYGFPLDWDKVGKLLTTLKSNKSALGRLVPNFHSVAHRIFGLDKLAAPSNFYFQVRGQSKAYSWSLAMLQACPNLRSVGVTFRNTTQLNKVVASLSPSFPTLETVKVVSAYSNHVTSEKVHAFASKLDLGGLETFEIACSTSGEVSNSNSTRLPFRLRSLRTSRQVTLQAATTFLPIDHSSLRYLNLYCVPWSPDELLDLVKLVGPTLISLALTPPLNRYETYGREHTSPIVPIEALSLSSPKLASFNRESVWLADSAVDSTGPGWQERIFPQAELATIFESFPNLKFLHGGIVPVNPAHPIATLEMSMRQKGVSLDWQECDMWCPGYMYMHVSKC